MQEQDKIRQLIAGLPTSKQIALQELIKKNLSTSKTLYDSYNELTGEVNFSIFKKKQTVHTFEVWLLDMRTDSPFSSYYIALLERIDDILSNHEMQHPISTTELNNHLPVTQQGTSKRRYKPERELPSLSERAQYHRLIEPARPRKQRKGLLFLVATFLLLSGVAYFSYPSFMSLFESNETKMIKPIKAPPEPEPVADQTNQSNEQTVWVTSKTTDLVSAPNSSSVTYVGDIGDRYTVLGKKDNFIKVDLGKMTAWAPETAMTTEWKAATLSNQDLLSWVKSNLDLTYALSLSETLGLAETELYDTIGNPYGEERDSLNTYAFYNGLFFTIQNEQIHAIDWTNTSVSKQNFMTLGEPTLETEDAVVYESENYSLRLFIGTNGSTRVRLTEL
ncbi:MULTISPECIES: hypothetical protein [Exiguobacterium]|uniref:hypothetical protein n=1 Tax=Exiguobacterium TaxID=33986 RepID=UPI001BEAA241|nr:MULTISPECIES: hypothetical protein [Exiguobacterium]MCT4781623.1 hypothetical protein [Exiguobacterium himgiriensis]